MKSTYYRWIVIENSLKDRNILKKYYILSETKFSEDDPSLESKMYKIRVAEDDVQKLAESLKENIIYPYYTHFYHEDPKQNKLIVVFSGKKFLVGKDNFQRAVDYGLAHDISKEELDISPREISQEEW